MGQGLFIKVAQVVADELGIDIARVKITATDDGEGAEHLGDRRLGRQRSQRQGGAGGGARRSGRGSRAARRRCGAAGRRTWSSPRARCGWAGARCSFAELAKHAHRSRVSLSATGFYRTPKIQYDAKTHRGRPFYYFAYGAAVSEVEIDTLTGEYKLRRVDILHDCGASLNPAIDLGQVEGGFVQGMGWLTSEELCWDAAGRITTHAPSTYKIPTCSDVPAEFHVALLRSGRNREPSIYRSKAVGEPPLMLGISVFHALRDAIAAVGEYQASPLLDAPATPERVLLAVEELRARLGRTTARAAAE